ncbi:hypothetical protein HN51_046496 [Arachis hypogaea]
MSKPSLPLISSSLPSSITIKLNRLVSEFNTLTEPMERMKRLLHYTSLLTPLGDSDRVQRTAFQATQRRYCIVQESQDEQRHTQAQETPQAPPLDLITPNV